MVIATDKYGIKKRVVCNENILMVNIEDSLSFIIKDSTTPFEFIINIEFSDEGKALSTSGTVLEGGKGINMTLHQWNDSVSTELTQPIEFNTNFNKKVWIKFKTSADKKNSFRSFHLTVWIEQ